MSINTQKRNDSIKRWENHLHNIIDKSNGTDLDIGQILDEAIDSLSIRLAIEEMEK